MNRAPNEPTEENTQKNENVHGILEFFIFVAQAFSIYKDVMIDF